jgi:hypothetical protein
MVVELQRHLAADYTSICKAAMSHVSKKAFHFGTFCEVAFFILAARGVDQHLLSKLLR